MNEQEKARKIVKVGIAGAGFMGREGHAQAYRTANTLFGKAHNVKFVVEKIYSLKLEDAQEAADLWDIPHPTDNLDDVVDGVDMVDICVPNFMHPEVAQKAADAGVKYFQSEKPLAADVKGAKAMVDAVKGKRGTITMVDFCYRFAPAVQLAKKWIEEGRITLRNDTSAEFLSLFRQDWGMDPSIGQEGEAVWRFSGKEAGEGGVWDDLGGHGMDLICYLLGKRVGSVSADTNIYIKERKGADGKMYPITALDAVNANVRMENGIRGIVKATRFDTGHKAYFTNEICGARGGIKWELEDLQWLQYFAGKRKHGDKWEDVPSDEKGWTKINVTNAKHFPTGAGYMRPGLTYGYADMIALMYVELAKAITGEIDGKPKFATFKDGLEQLMVSQAVVESGRNKMVSTPVVYKK